MMDSSSYPFSAFAQPAGPAAASVEETCRRADRRYSVVFPWGDGEAVFWANGFMLIGVLSDTHGHVGRTLEAVRLFESLEVEQVIHCGDIDTAEIVRLLGPWPVHFVFGNCDHREALTRAVEAARKTSHDRFGSLELEGKQIAFLHGDDRRSLEEAVASGRWDLVCYGHTHRAEAASLGRTLVLNPGAVFRSSRPSVAAVRLPELEVIELPLWER